MACQIWGIWGEPSRLEAWEQGGAQGGYNGLPLLVGDVLLNQSMSCYQVQARAVQGDKEERLFLGWVPRADGVVEALWAMAGL